MFYRRKIMLALLEALARPLRAIEIQKFMFLICRSQEKAAYEFIPHRFGCYSFQIESDKRTLQKYEMLEDDGTWTRSLSKGFRDLLKPKDSEILRNVLREFGHLRGMDLVQCVYRQHPYYAINSEIAHKILTKKELEAISAMRPKPASARLFTIGYQGLTLESYLHKLMVNQVRLLCDVRRNPISMKLGFSKKQLATATRAVGISYEHIPELGIESAKRKQLGDDQDYTSLFNDYRETLLQKNGLALDRVMHLISKYQRVALTCFEAHQHQCHRGCVVEALLNRQNFRHRVVHI